MKSSTRGRRYHSSENQQLTGWHFHVLPPSRDIKNCTFKIPTAHRLLPRLSRLKSSKSGSKPILRILDLCRISRQPLNSKFFEHFTIVNQTLGIAHIISRFRFSWSNYCNSLQQQFCKMRAFVLHWYNRLLIPAEVMSKVSEVNTLKEPEKHGK